MWAYHNFLGIHLKSKVDADASQFSSLVSFTCFEEFACSASVCDLFHLLNHVRYSRMTDVWAIEWGGCSDGAIEFGDMGANSLI